MVVRYDKVRTFHIISIETNKPKYNVTCNYLKYLNYIFAISSELEPGSMNVPVIERFTKNPD